MFHRILVVDDSPQVRRAVRHSIENRTEWLVLEAEHGKMARHGRDPQATSRASGFINAHNEWS
jgi:hypothetical protein